MIKKSRKNVVSILTALVLLVFCFVPTVKAESIFSAGGSCPSFLIFSTGAIFYLFVIGLCLFGVALITYAIIAIVKYCKRRNTV